MNEPYSAGSPTVLAWFDPDTCSWRMSQQSLLGEAELLEREELLLQREAEISRDVNSGSSWHAALILGLHEVQANVLQVHMACESAGSIR